jgi:hypothetical protein
MLKRKSLKGLGALQPYAAIQYAKFNALADAMVMYEAGVNWLIDGNRAKISLNLQNRPVFTANGAGDFRSTDRKNMLVMQMQVAI